jgi:hypothetical protein
MSMTLQFLPPDEHVPKDHPLVRLAAEFDCPVHIPGILLAAYSANRDGVQFTVGWGVGNGDRQSPTANAVLARICAAGKRIRPDGRVIIRQVAKKETAWANTMTFLKVPEHGDVLFFQCADDVIYDAACAPIYSEPSITMLDDKGVPAKKLTEDDNRRIKAQAKRVRRAAKWRQDFFG